MGERSAFTSTERGVRRNADRGLTSSSPVPGRLSLLDLIAFRIRRVCSREDGCAEKFTDNPSLREAKSGVTPVAVCASRATRAPTEPCARSTDTLAFATRAASRYSLKPDG